MNKWSLGVLNLFSSNNFQPTEVSVGGAGTYRLVYKQISPESDAGGGLSHVITPTGVHRVFSSFVSIGVKSLTMTPWALEAGPTSPPSAFFTYDWETRVHPSASTSRGQPLARFTWPSGKRVNVLQTKRLIVYDNTIVYWQGRSIPDATHVSLRDSITEFHLEVNQVFGAGKLVTDARMDVFLAGTKSVRSDIGGLLAYKFDYEYDHIFKVCTVFTYIHYPCVPLNDSSHFPFSLLLLGPVCLNRRKPFPCGVTGPI